MLQRLRQRWAIHRTYRRVQRLWAEYLAVSEAQDINIIAAKLTAFLDVFQEAYQEWQQQQQQQHTVNETVDGTNTEKRFPSVRSMANFGTDDNKSVGRVSSTEPSLTLPPPVPAPSAAPQRTMDRFTWSFFSRRTSATSSTTPATAEPIATPSPSLFPNVRRASNASLMSSSATSMRSVTSTVSSKQFMVSLDKIYGDCTDVLVKLLDLIERETQQKASNSGSSTQKTSDSNISVLTDLINKCLNVAELILKDEKYRVVVAQTPNLVKRILELLERLDSVEAKRLALRVICTLGENEQNKMEIGRLEGFRKMLRLLLEGDPALTQEIARTLKHLLDITGEKSCASNGIHSPTSPSKPLASPVGDRVSQVFVDLRQLVTAEVTRLFPGVSHAQQNETLAHETGASAAATVMEDVPGATVVAAALEEYRSRESVTVEDSAVPLSPSECSTSPLHRSMGSVHRRYMSEDALDPTPSSQPATSLQHRGSLKISRRKSNVGRPRRISASDLSTAPNQDTTTLLKEFMRVQGAISSLTRLLNQATLSAIGTLDIFETICKLLYMNSMSQTEFGRVDGYTILSRLLDTAKEGDEMLVASCFQLLFAVCLDGKTDHSIGNLYVMTLLVDRVTFAHSSLVRLNALHCVQDLMAVNPVNVAAVLHCHALPALLHRISNFILLSEPCENEDLEWLEASLTLLRHVAVLSQYTDSQHIMEPLFQLLSDALRADVLRVSLHLPLLDCILAIVQDFCARGQVLEQKEFYLRVLFDLMQAAIAPNGEVVNAIADAMTLPLLEIPLQAINVQDGEASVEKVPEVIVSTEVARLDEPHFSGSCSVEMMLPIVQTAALLLFQPHQLQNLVLDDVWFKSLAKVIRVASCADEALLAHFSAWLFVSLTSFHSHVSGLSLFTELLTDASLQSHDLLHQVLSLMLHQLLETYPNRLAVVEACMDCVMALTESNCQTSIWLMTLYRMYSIDPHQTKPVMAEKWGYGRILLFLLNKLETEENNFYLAMMMEWIMRPVCSQVLDLFVIMPPVWPKDIVTLAEKCQHPKVHCAIPSFIVPRQNNPFMEGNNGNALLLKPFMESESLPTSPLVNSNKGSDVPLPMMAVDFSLKSFQGRVFADAKAAASLMCLLQDSIKKPGTMKQVLALLTWACKADASNIQLLCQVDALLISAKLLIATASWDASLPMLWMQFIIPLGRYHLTQQHVQSLLHLTLDPQQQGHALTRQRSKSMMTIHELERMKNNSATGDVSQEQTQLRLLESLYWMAKGTCPVSFQQLNGLDTCLHISLDKFPSAKQGYTFSVWLNLASFHEMPLVGLLSLVQGQQSLLDVYFKRFQIPTLHYALCVQASQGPQSAPEDFVFDAVTWSVDSFTNEMMLMDSTATANGAVNPFLSSASTWIHLTLTHNQQGLTLTLNGQQKQTCSAFVYPRMAATRVTAVVGCYRGQSVAASTAHEYVSYLHARVAHVLFQEGCWSLNQIQSVYQGKTVMKESHCEVVVSSNTNAVTNATNNVSIVHSSCHPLSHVLGEMQGILLFCPFLDQDMTRSVSLQALSCLVALLHHAPNRLTFQQQQGPVVLQHLLCRRQGGLEQRVFELLLEWCCESGHEMKHPAAMQIVLDLLPLASLPLQKWLLKQFHFLLPIADNVSFMKQHFGSNSFIFWLLDLFHALSNDMTKSILQCLSGVHLSSEEVHLLMDYFLTWHDGSRRPSVLLFMEWFLMEQTQHFILDESHAPLLVCLLSVVTREKQQCQLLSLLQRTLQGNATAAVSFSKSGAWEVLRVLLSSQKVSLPLLQSLFSLAVDSSHILQFPEVIPILLSLSKQNTWMENSVCEWCMSLCKTPDNMVLLWENNWLEWFSISTHQNNASSFQFLSPFLGEMMTFDVTRKSSHSLKLKGAITENESLFSLLMQSLVESFLSSPVMESIHAENSLKSVHALFRYGHETFPPVSSLLLSMIHAIHHLAYHNTAHVRGVMKQVGLFELRDLILFHLFLVEDGVLAEGGVVEVVQQFVTEQPSNVLLLLWRLLHQSEALSDRKRIMEAVLQVMQSVSTSDEAALRRLLGKWLDDAVCERLFSLKGNAMTQSSPLLVGSHGGGGGTSLVASCDASCTSVQYSLGSLSSFDDDFVDSTTHTFQSHQNQGISHFLYWYFNADPDQLLRKSMIEQRLATACAPLLLLFSRHMDRLQQRRMKRLKYLQEKNLRQQVALHKRVVEWRQKYKLRVEKAAILFQTRERKQQEIREERIRLGQLLWI